MRELRPDAEVTYDDGSDPLRAAAAAAKADMVIVMVVVMVIVFAEQFTSEGYDVPSIALEGNQDALIAAALKAAAVLALFGELLLGFLDSLISSLESLRARLHHLFHHHHVFVHVHLAVLSKSASDTPATKTQDSDTQKGTDRATRENRFHSSNLQSLSTDRTKVFIHNLFVNMRKVSFE